MTITFFSNFLNHHQLPLCQEFIKLIGEENFHFVSCEKIHEERTKMGYEDMNVKYPFVVRAYESQGMKEKAIQLAEDSDIAIIGSAWDIFSKIRGRVNKTTFLFCERIFKNGSWHRFIPTTAYDIYNSFTRYRNKNFYILCASSYAASDFIKCGFPKEKCLKWGYFPELLAYPENRVYYPERKTLSLMWCGRMVWWKHPEMAIIAADHLKSKGLDFEIKMFGDGEKKQEIVNLIREKDLEPFVKLVGFLPPEKIRKEMIDSDVYLFTSGKQEGWGVVLNEAMNSGCAVIANINAGSSRYLVKDGTSGYLYDGSVVSFIRCLDAIINSNIRELGLSAYAVLKDDWNPQESARLLINFVTNGLMEDSHSSKPVTYC